MNSTTTELYRYNGSRSGDISACIGQLSLPAPDWSWYEPRPGYALDDNGAEDPQRNASALHPMLRRGQLSDQVPMDEARLFWRWGALHLLADDSGSNTRWSLWRAGGQPDIALEQRGAPEPASAHRDSILLRNGQELKRFGLKWPDQWGPASASASEANLIDVISYTGSNGLIGWTITGRGEPQ